MRRTGFGVRLAEVNGGRDVFEGYDMTKVTASTRPSRKTTPPGSFMGKVRKRGIIGALAALSGSGWLLYEIVHFILVDHYKLPEKLKDITIVSILCVMLCSLAWRWFREGRTPRRLKWEYILIPVFVLAAGAVNVNYLLHLSTRSLDAHSRPLEADQWRNAIAVLPFINMSPDKDQDYFCDGLTEEMITKLSQIPELKITARTSAFVFKGENRDIREVGQKLGVDKVLEGSVRKEGSRLRISAQLINVSDGFHIWSERYDRDLDRIFDIQDDIARSVAGALKIALLENQSPLSQTKSLEAYNEFLLGQYFYAAANKDNLEKAISHYERAVELDPEYARAWASLGAALALQANIGFVPTDEAYVKAVVAVERALALDETLAFGHVVRGWIRMAFDRDWAGAEASFSEALRLEPGRGPFALAQLELALGHFERAVVLARRAAELDSLNSSAQMNLGLAAFYAGRPEEALQAFAKTVELSPEHGNIYALQAEVYLEQSLPEMALALLDREKDPFFRLPALAMAYHALGRTGDSYDTLAQYIERFSEGGAFQIAEVYAFRGESSQAFEWLEIAYKQHDGGLYLAKADPFLRRLKDDARYPAFLKKLGLPLEGHELIATN